MMFCGTSRFYELAKSNVLILIVNKMETFRNNQPIILSALGEFYY